MPLTCLPLSRAPLRHAISFTHSKKKRRPQPCVRRGHRVVRGKTGNPRIAVACRVASSLLSRRYWSPRNRVDLSAILAPAGLAGFPILKRRELLHNAAPCHAVVSLTIPLMHNAWREVGQRGNMLAALRKPRPRACCILLLIDQGRFVTVAQDH